MDAIDRGIVDLLRENARLSFAELARQVGLSAPAVHERVGKLEASGVIRGYRADVRPDAIGQGITAIIGIVPNPQTEFDEVVGALESCAEIESCYFTAGEESFLLKARVGTIEELEGLIVRLNRTAEVASTRTTVVLSTKWEGRHRPGAGRPTDAAPPASGRLTDAAPPASGRLTDAAPPVPSPS